MIGIPKDDLGFHLIHQLLLGHGFYTAHGANGHEYRRQNFPVIGADFPGPGFAVGIPVTEFKTKCGHRAAR